MVIIHSRFILSPVRGGTEGVSATSVHAGGVAVNSKLKRSFDYADDWYYRSYGSGSDRT